MGRLSINDAVDDDERALWHALHAKKRELGVAMNPAARRGVRREIAEFSAQIMDHRRAYYRRTGEKL